MKRITRVDELIAALCDNGIYDMHGNCHDATSHARIRGVVPQFVEDKPDDNTIRAIYEREIGYDTNHITAWLIEHEYDGLVNTETDSCGCGIENLAPCGHIEGDCKLGFRHRDGLMYEKPEDKK